MPEWAEWDGITGVDRVGLLGTVAEQSGQSRIELPEWSPPGGCGGTEWAKYVGKVLLWPQDDIVGTMKPSKMRFYFVVLEGGGVLSASLHSHPSVCQTAAAIVSVVVSLSGSACGCCPPFSCTLLADFFPPRLYQGDKTWLFYPAKSLAFKRARLDCLTVGPAGDLTWISNASERDKIVQKFRASGGGDWFWVNSGNGEWDDRLPCGALHIPTLSLVSVKCSFHDVQRKSHQYCSMMYTIHSMLAHLAWFGVITAALS